MTSGAQKTGSIEVIALASVPVEAAATRLRLMQYFPLLAERGVNVAFLPFLDGRGFADLYNRGKAARTSFRVIGAFFRRLLELPRILRADVVLVQREAMLFGPPLIEWIVARVAKRPMIVDLDDPTWLPAESPVYGRLAAILKWRRKTDSILRWATMVMCGNEAVASHVRTLGGRAVVVPTIVDPIAYGEAAARPAREIPVIGWIGSHSTWPYMEAILPVLAQLAQTDAFRLRVVGCGRDSLPIENVPTEVVPWRLANEIHEFRDIDIGLYPLREDAWAAAKSGLKAMQYLASGLPYVATPAGVVADIGEPGATHFLARNSDEWLAALQKLVRDRPLRETMGRAGRRYAVDRLSLARNADAIAAVIREAASGA